MWRAWRLTGSKSQWEEVLKELLLPSEKVVEASSSGESATALCPARRAMQAQAPSE